MDLVSLWDHFFTYAHNQIKGRKRVGWTLEPITDLRPSKGLVESDILLGFTVGEFRCKFSILC